MSDRVMCLKMEIDGALMNVIGAYALQIWCVLEEQGEF